MSALLAALTADQTCVVGLPVQRANGDATALVQIEASALSQVGSEVLAE